MRACVFIQLSSLLGAALAFSLSDLILSSLADSFSRLVDCCEQPDIHRLEREPKRAAKHEPLGLARLIHTCLVSKISFSPFWMAFGEV